MDELIIEERKFRKDLVNLVNDAKLPAIILKPIFKEYLEQILQLEQQQYNEALKNIEEKEEKENGQD